MCVVDAGIDHADRDGWAAFRNRPGFRGIDVCPWGAAEEAQVAGDPRDAVEGLAGIVHAPLFPEVRVAGKRHRRRHRLGCRWNGADEVQLRVEHVRVALVSRDGGSFVARTYSHALYARASDLVDERGAGRPVRRT